MSDDTDPVAEADKVGRLSGHSTRLAPGEAGAIEAHIFRLRVRWRVEIDWMTDEATQGDILRSIEREG
jgi:hypothetical protein